MARLLHDQRFKISGLLIQTTAPTPQYPAPVTKPDPDNCKHRIRATVLNLGGSQPEKEVDKGDRLAHRSDPVLEGGAARRPSATR